jgi:hypothetical protein
MWTIGPGRRLALVTSAVLLGAVVTAAGCTHPVAPNPGDATAPVVTLDVDQLPGEGLLTVSSQPETRTGVPRSAQLALIAVAKDEDSGVAQVSLRGDITTRCAQPDGELGQDRRAAILTIAPAGTATTEPAGAPNMRVVQMTVAFPYTRCEAGFEPVGMMGHLHAEGRNGAGATARNADFTFAAG